MATFLCGNFPHMPTRDMNRLYKKLSASDARRVCCIRFNPMAPGQTVSSSPSLKPKL